MLKELYQRDYNLWIEKVKERLAARDFHNMDWDNLLEEIEDMGASQKRALRSYYYRLVEHILKLRDWEEEKARNEIGWRVKVTNFRRAIDDILEDSPSLKNYLQDNYLNWFQKVVDNYRRNKLFTVKDTTAISLEKILDDNFFG